MKDLVLSYILYCCVRNKSTYTWEIKDEIKKTYNLLDENYYQRLITETR